MKGALEAYLWVGLLFGLLTFGFGMLRERSKDQVIWMSALKWSLGAGAAALAWPIAAYWVVEGELIKRNSRSCLDTRQSNSEIQSIEKNSEIPLHVEGARSKPVSGRQTERPTVTRIEP